MVTYISGKTLRMTIGAFYTKTDIPRERRTKYSGKTVAELLSIAESIGAVKKGVYRVSKRKMSQKQKDALFTKGHVPVKGGKVGPKPKPKTKAKPKPKTKRKPRAKKKLIHMEVNFGVRDRAHKNAPNRTTLDQKKWQNNRKYWDYPTLDTGITVKELKALAKRHNIYRYSTMKKAELINRIARLQTVKKN